MYDLLLQHRSIRKFKETAIPNEVMAKLLMAASRASNTGNMQVYSIIVSTTDAIKEQLWAAHFKQDMVKRAPAIFTFCADFNRFNKWCELRNAKPGYDNFISFMTGAIDATLAAQNLTIAAEAEGLGICYLGTALWNAHLMIDILKLPKGVVPITAIAVGYAEETPELTPRLPLEAVVHMETYKDFEAEDIERIYSDFEQLEQTKNLIELNKKETLAQIFTDIRYTEANNVAFSDLLLDVLKKQGYLYNKV